MKVFKAGHLFFCGKLSDNNLVVFCSFNFDGSIPATCKTYVIWETDILKNMQGLEEIGNILSCKFNLMIWK